MWWLLFPERRAARAGMRSKPMPAAVNGSSREVAIDPLPLMWLGHYEDLPDRGEEPWPVGWAFFADAGSWLADRDRLSERYLVTEAKHRKPIVVLCPLWSAHWGRVVGTPFCVDHVSTTKREPWRVEVDPRSLVVGARPDISVDPSIHLIGIWHGWLKHGVLAQSPQGCVL